MYLLVSNADDARDQDRMRIGHAVGSRRSSSALRREAIEGYEYFRYEHGR